MTGDRGRKARGSRQVRFLSAGTYTPSASAATFIVGPKRRPLDPPVAVGGTRCAGTVVAQCICACGERKMGAFAADSHATVARVRHVDGLNVVVAGVGHVTHHP